MTALPDFEVEDHGSIWLLKPRTLRGDQWLVEHLEDGPEYTPRYGTGFAVEARYVLPIIEGAEEEGLTVA